MTIIAAKAPLAQAVSISAGRRVTISAGLRNNGLFSASAARRMQFFPTPGDDYALFHPQQVAKQTVTIGHVILLISMKSAKM
jgi:hypothetical protein